MWSWRIGRCLAADMIVKEWYALNKVAESSLCEWTARFREEEPRPLFPQVERGVELDEGHASLPRAAALRARFPLPVRVNKGWRCVSFDAAVCARISVGGCRGFARGHVPASSGRFRRKWASISPWFWTSVRFSTGLFAVGFADLGKRRRIVAFRAGSACETAQKLQVGLACVEGGAS